MKSDFQTFWIFEILGEKVVSDLKTLAPKGCKIAATKKSFYRFFLFVLNVFLPPLLKVQCPNFLYFWNPGKKVMLIDGAKLVIDSAKLQRSFFLVNFAFLAGFFWYQCYYPHRSRDATSPVWVIFLSINPLGRCFHRVAMSVYIYIC